MALPDRIRIDGGQSIKIDRRLGRIYVIRSVAIKALIDPMPATKELNIESIRAAIVWALQLAISNDQYVIASYLERALEAAEKLLGEGTG
jgi:hypothetical protein